MKHGYVRYALRALLMGLFTALTMTVYPAVVMYCQNVGEFWFTLSQGMPGVLRIGGMLWAALTVLLLIMPKKARPVAMAVVMALTVAMLLQMMVLNADYGTLDGKEIDWTSFTVYGIINTVTWLAILVLCLKLARSEVFHRLTVILPVLLVLLEGGYMLNLLSDLPPQQMETSELQLTSTGLNTVGQDNLLVLIVDSVDAEDLTEALAEDASWAEELDGFTFYRAAMGLSDPTKYGLPAILTGQVQDQPVSYGAFITSAYGEAPLFSALRAEDYDVRVFTDSRYIDMEASQIANAERATSYVRDEDGLTRDLLRLCAFRYAPHFLKPQLWMYSNVFAQYKEIVGSTLYQENDERYMEALAADGLTLADGRAFRAIHLVGMHPPYTMDADCTYQQEGVTAQEQMQGVMKIVTAYLDQLRVQGVYDASDVLILADHGTEAVQNPMLLLKRKGAAGSLVVSDAPVSYADLNATYLALLGEDAAGTPLWEIPEGTARDRYYYHEQSRNNEFNLYQYVSSDLTPSFDELEKTGVVYHGDTTGAIQPYTLGDTLYFDLRATARPYEVSGFSSADHMSTWTSGDTGEMRIPLSSLPTQDVMTVRLSFLSVMQGSQRLVVTCGGQTVFDETVTDMHAAFTVPSTLVSDGVLTLDFTYPDAISHLDAGKSSDTRKVAFAVVSLSIADGE